MRPLPPDAVTGDTTTVLFHARCRRSADAPAVRHFRAGRWVTCTWNGYARHVRATAGALTRLAVRRGDRVAVWAETCFAWAVLDLAAQSLGAVVVSVHPAYSPEEAAYALRVADVRALFWGGERPAQNLDAVQGLHPVPLGAYPLEEFAFQGDSAADVSPHTPAPEDVATVLFTSGSSGVPKAVCLTHRNLVTAAGEGYRHMGYFAPRPTSFHYLPFAHIMGRMGMYLDMAAGSVAAYGRGVPHLRDDLRACRPEVLFAVPKVLQRFKSAVEERLREQPAWKQALFTAALRASTPRSVPLLRRTVFAPVLRQMGGKLNLFIVGGAPTDPDTAAFFERLGVRVRDGYGLTETTGACFMAPYHDPMPGTSGTALGDLEWRVEGDGELLLRGGAVFRGYLDPTHTAEAFTPDGWFRTGDLAAVDEAGRLSVTGRKKSLLITAGGENVSPERVEAALTRHPLFADAFVVGDGRPYLAALLHVNSGHPAAQGSVVELNAAVVEALSIVNEALAAYETVRASALLEREFSVDAGELTPTLKKRRDVIAARYADRIASLYAGEAVRGPSPKA